MKSFSDCRMKNSPGLAKNKGQAMHLVVPEQKASGVLLSTRDSYMPNLSTRIQSNSGRSSDEGSQSNCFNSQMSNQDFLISSHRDDAINRTPVFMGPRETMEHRWMEFLENTIPKLDLEDVNALLADPQAGRQFAPEFSQSSYMDMLQKDYAIGDYIQEIGESQRFSYSDRERLISIVQDLNKKKDYKQETLHLAGSIADRYLSIILRQGKEVPNLFALAATVMLMAAKLE